VSYHLSAVERGGRWIAHAVHHDTGRRFGIDCAGETRSEAIDRLTRWLAWQSDHDAALLGLQSAERAYHRAVASSFSNRQDAPAAIEIKRKSLEALDAARVLLDHVRSRQPEQSS
jgi:hypothetical protein